MKRITRQGDSGGRLVLVVEDDGDVVLQIQQPAEAGHFEFCTGAGGGRSPKVLRALKALAEAMEEENTAGRHPHMA